MPKSTFIDSQRFYNMLHSEPNRVEALPEGIVSDRDSDATDLEGRISALENKIDALNSRLDFIFGKNVVIKGRFVDLSKWTTEK